MRARVCVDTNIGFKYVKNLKKKLSYFFIFLFKINDELIKNKIFTRVTEIPTCTKFVKYIHTIELKNKKISLRRISHDAYTCTRARIF